MGPFQNICSNIARFDRKTWEKLTASSSDSGIFEILDLNYDTGMEL